jgi:hypothetical protein
MPSNRLSIRPFFEHRPLKRFRLPSFLHGFTPRSGYGQQPMRIDRFLSYVSNAHPRAIAVREHLLFLRRGTHATGGFRPTNAHARVTGFQLGFTAASLCRCLSRWQVLTPFSGSEAPRCFCRCHLSHLLSLSAQSFTLACKFIIPHSRNWGQNHF